MRSTSGYERSAVCVAGNSVASHGRIQAIEQEGLIVIHLDKGAKTPAGRRPARAHVENAGLRGVDFDEGLGAGNHHGTPARSYRVIFTLEVLT